MRSLDRFSFPGSPGDLVRAIHDLMISMSTILHGAIHDFKRLVLFIHKLVAQ